PMLEEKYGSERILALIAITALFTGIANYILFPNTALCGASGVVFAMILLASFANIRSGEIPLTLILVAVIYLGREVYDGLFVADQVSNLSHIIGGLVGAGIGYRFNQK
ncbi:MAG: rhomboid family intramembrane serine protease, partial [Solobacterium sp.]|nr:rhomboid family intramembrane serine protease [Solobacterium sp.]